MKPYCYFILYLFIGISTSSCFEDNDDVIRTASDSEIKDFIWRGMNIYYLYKENVSELADDRFSSNQQYEEFLNSFSSPETLFDGLLSDIDRFSFLVDDYVALERSFDGISRNNGMEYGLIRNPEDRSKIFGFVRYVLPGTDAEAKGIKRGFIFNSIDGIQLNDQNFRELLAPDTYTIGLAIFDGSVVTSTNESVTLTKTEYVENPVFISKVLPIEGKKIGYLMYNAFNDSFEPQMNSAFGQFVSEGVTELVVDLRYNGGGNVETAKDLSSMITGQFDGEIFTTEEWNSQLQEVIKNDNPARLINRFDNRIGNGDGINSLGLQQVYIITTNSSASASELVINGLDPYINVIKVGDTTRGKFQASITLYDSNDFRRQRANLGHTYAMQPLVLKTINSVGFTDYFNGFAPDIVLEEDFSNAGELGDINEPLLKAAIDAILAGKSFVNQRNNRSLPTIGDSDMFDPSYERMYKTLE